MARIDLETRLNNLDFGLFVQETTEFLNLPSIYQLNPEGREIVAECLNPKGRAGAFIRWMRSRTGSLIKKGDYQFALDLAHRSADKSTQVFNELESDSVRLHSIAIRGEVFEHLATKGPYKDHILRDRLFLMAAHEYMKIDRGIGVVTPYAQRTSECFGGAGYHFLQVSSLAALYANRNLIIMGPEGREEFEKAIKGKGTTKKIGRVPFGGSIKLVSIPASAIPPNFPL